MGEFGFSEMVLIAIVAIVIYGKDLPSAARKMAQVYNKLRRQLTDVKDEIQRQIPIDEIKGEFNKVGSSFDPTAPQTEIPMPPSGIYAQVADAAKVLVTWNSVPGATTYSLKRSTSSTDPLLIVSMGLTDLSYTDSGLETGKTYHYVVTAQNSAGESGSSEEAVVTLPAEEPATVAAAPASATEEVASAATAVPAPQATGNDGGLEPMTKVQEPSAPATPPAEAPAPQGTGNGSAQEPVTKSEEPPAA